MRHHYPLQRTGMEGLCLQGALNNLPLKWVKYRHKPMASYAIVRYEAFCNNNEN